MNIAPASDIRLAEQELFATGACSSEALMNVVIKRLRDALLREPMTAGFIPKRVVVYAGRGNNAGDALGLAATYGCPVTLRTACRIEELSPDSRRQLFRITAPLSMESVEPQPDLLIIDGLLGSGAKGELRPPYAELVQEMNALRSASPRSLLLAIDIPTGLDADSGVTGQQVVEADITAAIGCVKPGMLTDGAEDAVGRLLCIPLPEVTLHPGTADRVLCRQEIAGWLARRPYSHFKNRAGRVEIIAGSPGYIGAAQLCAEAAVAAGAGLVNLHCPESVYPLLAVRVAPEIMVTPIPAHTMPDISRADALVIGPGMGRLPQDDAAALYRLICSTDRPVVLDADALNTAAEYGWHFRPNHILTPHPGEMARLAPNHASTRRETALNFAARHSCTLLLKGARSIIANADRLYYNSSGGPFMANGGQGDVLAGCIGALSARGLTGIQAAALGAYACGRAAETAWAQSGYPQAIRASDVISYLGQQLPIA